VVNARPVHLLVPRYVNPLRCGLLHAVYQRRFLATMLRLHAASCTHRAFNVCELLRALRRQRRVNRLSSLAEFLQLTVRDLARVFTVALLRMLTVKLSRGSTLRSRVFFISPAIALVWIV
jgi:hypothetical protein